jgi:hypothetical protein
MTDTPRTDHAWRGREAQDYADSAHVVSLDLARTLERELIVCEALLEKTEKAHEAALKEAVAAAETRVHERWADALSKNASMHVVLAVTRELNARKDAAHD